MTNQPPACSICGHPVHDWQGSVRKWKAAGPDALVETVRHANPADHKPTRRYEDADNNEN